MVTLTINNKEIEQSLMSQFETKDEMNQYLNNLIIEDIEDRKFGNVIARSDNKDFVSREDIFQVLN